MNVFGEYNLKIKPAKRITLDFKSPFQVFQHIYQEYPNSFLLESMESDSGLARYSLLGFEPLAIIKAYDKILEIEIGDEKQEFDIQNPFHEIKQLIKPKPGQRGFQGGLVGYVSYEAVRYLEPISLPTGNFPDLEMGLFLDCIIFDRLKNQCHYVTLNKNRVQEIKKIPQESDDNELRFTEKSRHHTPKEYKRMVLEAKKKIKKGEIFQSVLSNAREYEIDGNKLLFYKKLREINPSPYMYHFKLGEREIIGSSPEMLMRVEKGQVETFPIAGTRRRGKNSGEDERLKNELLADEKERAEHLMLIDLARNDVGKVSQFGTVQVPQFMQVKKFSHVQHIVSQVTGKLKPDLSSIDAFCAMFPAGTLSGAPKIRAMEIIRDLEKIPRGPYGGAIGYFSLNGNADFAITIRSLICNGKKAVIQAGAGIVHDSSPEAEYQECEKKADAMISALEAVARRG